MIQRIQTVFLVVALFLVGLMFFMPYANLSDVYTISLKGLRTLISSDPIQQSYVLVLLGSVTIFIILVIIFLFKNRKLQMNLCLVSILLLLVLGLVMYFTIRKFNIQLNAEVKYNVSIIFPVISAILIFLAYRSIRKDERLIKSLDRLR